MCKGDMGCRHGLGYADATWESEADLKDEQVTVARRCTHKLVLLLGIFNAAIIEPCSRLAVIRPQAAIVADLANRSTRQLKDCLSAPSGCMRSIFFAGVGYKTRQFKRTELGYNLSCTQAYAALLTTLQTDLKT